MLLYVIVAFLLSLPYDIPFYGYIMFYISTLLILGFKQLSVSNTTQRFSVGQHCGPQLFKAENREKV